MSYTEKAVKIAESIQKATSYLDDEQAESVTNLFPFWEADMEYSVGDRRQFEELLYRCVKRIHPRLAGNHQTSRPFG